MSLSQNPMTGIMHKSMANFVTTTYRGRNVIKAKVFMPKDVNSPAQQNQRACFKLIVKEYESFGGIPDLGFTNRPRVYSPYNAFMKANLSTAIDKTGPNPVINYSKLVVSSGTLTEVIVTAAKADTTGIVISYKSSLKDPKVLETDEMVAFAKLKNHELIIERKIRGNSATGSILLEYPDIDVNDVVCCYVFALSADGSNASNSTYVVVN